MKTDIACSADSSAVCSITLSRDCEIIDICDELKSCPDKSVDRTVLFNSMTAADTLKLTKLCGDPLPHRDSMVLRMRLYDYRYGHAQGIGGTVTLHLYKSYRELIRGLAESRDPAAEALLSRARYFPELFSRSSPLESSDAVTLLRHICSRMAKSGEEVSSRIVFDESEVFLSDEKSVGCVPAGPLALTFITLLTTLDSVSSDGILNVSVSRFSGSFEVRMRTKCNSVDHTVGAVSDVLLLSRQLKGATPALTLAALAASESEMNLSGEVSPAGELSFFFGYIPETLPALEFKFDDPRDGADSLIDSVFRLLRLLPSTFE